jgi:hypothetical protein
MPGAPSPTRATDRVRVYLLEHPSVRHALALGVLNDAAVARRIRTEVAEHLSFEAVAVALRRAERGGLELDPRSLAARLLAQGRGLSLETGYSVLRFTDTEAALSAFVDRPVQGPRTGRSFLHVEEGHRYISVACPSTEVSAVTGGLPRGTRWAVTGSLALVLITAAGTAAQTPGVIAFLADRLSERGLQPHLLAAAGSEIAVVSAEGEATEVFGFLDELRGGQPGEPGGARAKSSSGSAGSEPGAGALARRRDPDGRSGADIARQYVASHPSIADCLGYGLVNFTALARRIAREVRFDNPVAVEAALRRWRVSRTASTSVESQILAVVRQSRIEVRTRVALVTAPPTWELLGRLVRAQPESLADRRRLFQVLQSPTSVTVLCDEDLVDPVLRAMGNRPSVEATRRLAAIVVHSPETILETPGVLAFLSGAIYRSGLNCLELMSLHLESTFVVRQADALAVFGVLSDLVHRGPGGGAGASAAAG